MIKSRNIARVLLLICVLLFLSAASASAQWGGERGDPFDGTFTKTVALAPGVCSSDREISVVPGTTVYYCYRVNNPPQFAYNYSIVDDILGPISSGTMLGNTTLEVFASSPIAMDTFNIANVTLTDAAINDTILLGPGGGLGIFSANASVLVNENGSGIGQDFNPAIPTLSEYALFAFGGLLILGAALTLRRSAS